MDKRYKPKVGQELYLVEPCVSRNMKQKEMQCKVKSVGRKYFSVETGSGWKDEWKFNIDTWVENADTNYKSKLYESKEEYDRIIENQELKQHIRSWFSINSYIEIENEDLKSIKEIIDKYKG